MVAWPNGRYFNIRPNGNVRHTSSWLRGGAIVNGNIKVHDN